LTPQIVQLEGVLPLRMSFVTVVEANVRLTGVMEKSGAIAASLSELMKVEQLQGISQQFAQELMKV